MAKPMRLLNDGAPDLWASVDCEAEQTAFELTAGDIGLLRGVRDRLALDGHGALADKMTKLLHELEAA